MASATARPTFSFHHHQLHYFHPTKPSTALLPSTNKPISYRLVQHHHHHFTFFSIDVSKEDKPTSQPQDSKEANKEPDREMLERRREEERFAVLNTGIYECRSCGYRYDEAVGDPSYPIPPGFSFAKLPEDWRCATCGAAKSFFDSKSVEIAGFAQNQQYGLGGNALTAGQKAFLIYGGLFLGFVLFLSGYFLQ